MEIYYLYTRPLEIAREAGCPMPKLEMLEAELRFLDPTLLMPISYLCG
jgi:2-dehydropantoate 2-reductase